MKIRTDLAMESPSYTKKTGELKGIKVTEKKNGDINLIRMDVLNHNGEMLIGKPLGTYITLEAPGLSEMNDDYHYEVTKILAEQIKELIKGAYSLNSKVPEVLVVGLGNIEATPDSLGPRVVSNLLITKPVAHKIKDNSDVFGIVSAFSPGVMAQTGIETSEIINAIVRKTEPDILLVIDSLAARSITRLNSTIQIANTGIDPGSGVGNHRMAINKKTMGVPVIAIGIPTVVDAATLIYDATDSKMEDEYYNMYRQMYVTTKDIDAIINRVSYTVSEAVNMCMSNEI